MNSERVAKPTTPNYSSLSPASAAASMRARAASVKTNTRCEIALRTSLRKLGVRTGSKPSVTIIGRPDIAFRHAKVVVFCDGDFWHGRRLRERMAKLSDGHNAPYWVAKLQTNVARDRRHNRELRREGWLVLRFWETDIKKKPDVIAAKIAAALEQRKLSGSAHGKA